MENTYLIVGSKELIKKINELSINKNIKVLNYDVSDPSYLSLNAPSPSEVVDIWEIITYFATIGGAIGFLKEIKSIVAKGTVDNNSTVIRTNNGTTINISSNTTEVEIEEYAEKTIVKIK